jgi:N-methylhydantoinase A
LDEEVVRQVAAELQREKVEAAVVCYLFSFMNPAHERRTAEILREVLPELHLSVSSEILPVIREYERLSTATLNAYVMPIMHSYLRKLRARLKAGGYRRELYLMQSSGGIMSSSVAADRPVYTIDSGPAGGVTAAAQLGASLGYPDVISFDMGGTTAKICVVRDGRPEVTTRFWLGGKYFIGVPVMDMVEIGAGGGSIAHVDQAGQYVGPQRWISAGPACYGKGGGGRRDDAIWSSATSMPSTTWVALWRSTSRQPERPSRRALQTPSVSPSPKRPMASTAWSTLTWSGP